MAASLASAPLLQKKTLSAFEFSHSQFAKAACAGIKYKLETWCMVCICLVTAAVNAGLLCPKAQVAIPLTQSKYFLPSVVVNQHPSPDLTVNGYRLECEQEEQIEHIEINVKKVKVACA